MALLNRMTLIRVHMYLAVFMFPVALMFLITGGLYTWSVKGSYETESVPVNLTAPLTDDLQVLRSLVEAELDSRGLPYPSGKPGVKKGGTSYKLEWTGASRDVVLEPTPDPLVATLTIKETTLYRNFVQLHKAKGGIVFKFYAAGLATALFLILLSGFIVAWQMPKYRREVTMAFSAGLAVFAAAFLLS